VTTERRPYRILLAEDSAGDVGLVRIALRDQRLDHILQVVSDGAEAIGIIEAADNDRNVLLDLLLLDMHLPKYDGDEILERLRSTKRYTDLPVVVMTSTRAPQDCERAQKYAPTFYFRKPSSLDEYRHLGVIVFDILAGRSPSEFAPSPLENKGGKA